MRSISLLPLLFLATPALPQPTVTVMGATPTQAVLSIRDYSGTCTIAVSEFPGFSPLHPDLDGTEYTGASTDLGRADTITQSDGTRLVAIGHMNDDRALAAATTYYWRVSDCGGAATGVFSTPTLGIGSNQQWPVPFNSAKPWNYGYPTVNLINPTWVVDPITGVKLRPLNSARDRTWRTGAGTNPPASGFTTFQNWSGGTGWASPANVLNASASTASTSNTNPIDLYGMYNRFTYGNADGAFLGISFDDLGAVIWGSATNQTSGNNQISVCIFTSPSAGCLGTPITITLTETSGAPAKPSASSDPDHPWPNNFPTPFFNGWGLTAPLGPDHVNTNGSLVCTAGVCTIAAPTFVSFFPNTMEVGQKVFIAGSSPVCTGNLCTMASFQHAGQITLSENLTVPAGTAFNVYMWGLRIAKVTATGSVTVGAAFKHAGSLGVGQADASSFACNPHSLTSGDGHTGFICAAPSTTNVSGRSPLYFVSGDGTVRSLWNNIAWPSSTCYTYPATNDRPNVTLFIGQPQPDANDARTFYVNSGNGAGSNSLFKLVYSGDLTEDFGTNYQYAQSGDGPVLAAPPCGHWMATNLNPPSLSMDIPSQIRTKWSSVFDSTIFPNTSSSWVFTALVPGYAVYNNLYGGGQNSPAWIGLVNLSTGVLDKLFDTLSGAGTTSWYGGMRWGGLHTILSNYRLDALVIQNNAVVANNSSQLLAGPFEVTPLAKLNADGLTWNTDTSLPWPINNSYYNACPAANQFVFLGAAGSNCVTFKFPAGGACNVAPSTLERSKFPACPWNSRFTAPVPLVAGDVFVDYSLAGNCGGSSIFNFLCEQFRIISVTPITGALQVVVQRNAMYDYCSFNPTNFPGTNVNHGVLAPTQLQHANAWVAVMSPSRINGCYSDSYVWSGTANGIIGESSLLTGHGGIIPGSVAGSPLASIIVGTQVRTDKTLDSTLLTGLFGYPTTVLNLAGPTFHGLSGGIGSIQQSYVDSVGANPWETDANSLNPSFGVGPEINSNSIGPVRLTYITADVYTITPISNGVTLSKAYYKLFPLLGWAGRYLLHDISGPPSTMSFAERRRSISQRAVTSGVSALSGDISSSPWSMCYVYHAGECLPGSSENTLYVNVPGAYNSGVCHTGQSFLIAPCVVFGSPGAGGVRQQRITRSDRTGQGSRLLTYLLTSPGEHYPFTHIVSSPDHSFALGAAHHTQGWSTMAWVLKLPPWQEDSIDRTDLIPVGVQIPPGPKYAEIQFGYSRYIGANRPAISFYCTARAESCNTSGTPYNFESERRTLKACTSGCTINIPVTAPNLVYYLVRRSDDGVNWSKQEVQALALP